MEFLPLFVEKLNAEVGLVWRECCLTFLMSFLEK